MEKRTRVAVYGGSLHMASIAASLRAEPDLEVVSIDPGSLPAGRGLDESDASPEVEAHGLPPGGQEQSKIGPDVILFDSQAMQPELRRLLAGEGPGPLLIGLDVSSNEMLVLRGYKAQALSVTDLVNIILGRESRPTDRKEIRGTV